MGRDVNPCTWLSPSALQSELRPVSVTPVKSPHPALTAGSLPHTRVTHAMIKVHKYTCMHTHVCAENLTADVLLVHMFMIFYVYTCILFQLSSLIALEVETQPCTLQYWLWFPCRISMDAAGGIWNKSQHIIARRLQTNILIFLSLSHYFVVVAVYEWFCIIHASYFLAVTVDLQMTHMQKQTGAMVERRAKCERNGKWSLTESNPPATCFASKCQYLGQFLSLKVSAEGK